jgi:tRNA U34 2-thiouridine synthase MnmA/TrmU
MDRKSIKTLGLLSGGLDSTIAVRMMVKLGYDVTVLNFMSPFCTCTKKSNGCKSAAHKAAAELGVKIKTAFMGGEYLQMLRAPKYGVGKGMNPCIDCRIMMFRQAKRVMDEVGAKFIFTGEVIGQRPMSQMKGRLNQIENESGLKGLIVRPLSAAIMEPTIPEKEGWIDRDEMLKISGKSRRQQISVGRDMGIAEENLCSSGGCLLTDLHFAPKVKDMLEHSPDADVNDARMLRIGRHFRVADNCKVVVGRNEKENEKLQRMAKEGSTLIRVRDFNGPCVVVIGEIANGLGLRAGQIAVRYSDAPKDRSVEVEIQKVGTYEKSTFNARAIDDNTLNTIRI